MLQERLFPQDMFFVFEVIQLRIQETFFSVFEINANEDAAHGDKHLTLFEIFACRGWKDDLEQVLQFRELPGFEKLKAKLDSLDVVVEWTVVHEMQEVNGKIFNSQLKPNHCSERCHSMPHNVPGNLLQFDYCRIKVDVEKSWKSLTQDRILALDFKGIVVFLMSH